MRDLIIKHKLISQHPLIDIINKLKEEVGDFMLSEIRVEDDNIAVSCPFHKGGKEKHASCMLYNGKSKDLEFGSYHCWSCGASGHLYDFIGECFGEDSDYGKRWLLDNFGDIYIEGIIDIEDFEDNNKENVVLDKSLFNGMLDYHPYMTQRKLTPEVIRKFEIKYNPSLNTIVFPVYDEHNNLVLITQRQIDSKRFYINKNTIKPVYLLNDILKEGNKSVFVCESQINALTLRSWGYPSVALFGTGDEYQYDLLKKSGIINYILCFDGDEAGRKGTYRFIESFRNKNVMINDLKMTWGKDVNDLSKEEFDKLLDKCYNEI